MPRPPETTTLASTSSGRLLCVVCNDSTSLPKVSISPTFSRSIAPAAAPKAAEALKVSADHLEKLGVVDEVIPEPLGGAHNDPHQAASALKYVLQKHLNDLRALDTEKLLETRYERFRHLGVYEEAGAVRT